MAHSIVGRDLSKKRIIVIVPIIRLIDLSIRHLILVRVFGFRSDTFPHEVCGFLDAFHVVAIDAIHEGSESKNHIGRFMGNTLFPFIIRNIHDLSVM